MFSVRELVFTVFIGFFFCGPQHANGECNGLTTYLNSSSQKGSFYMYMDSYGSVNRSCTWLITAPIGQRVLIYLTSLSFLYCYSDTGITITDGPYTWSPRLAQYCGKDLPRPVYSSGRQILITFQPSFASYEDFTLHYSTLFHHSSGCPSIVPGASAGVIYSPNFPWNYAESKLCYWYIRVPYHGHQNISINFTYFNPYDCESSLLIYNEHGDLKTRVSLCYSPTPSSVTYSESVIVRYYPYYSSSSFLAFYQIGYDVPFPKTTYPPLPTSQSYRGCQPYSEKSIFVQGSESTSISSSVTRDLAHTLQPGATCIWKIATMEGYTLELKFDEMYISKCYQCSCGYVTVRDGSESSARSIGTFCKGNVPSVVSSTENHMFVRFYAENPFDFFKASIDSKETQAHRLRIPGIVVPIVIGVVLFAVIITIIKCIKIRRSTGEEDSSQLPFLLESPLPDDEEMIDLTEDNNTACGNFETT